MRIAHNLLLLRGRGRGQESNDRGGRIVRDDETMEFVFVGGDVAEVISSALSLCKGLLIIQQQSFITI